MAEIALAILGPAIELVKWVGAPIKRQFSYLCCFTCNVASLEHEAEILDYETGKLQDRVTQDKNNGREEIYKLVQDWITASGNVTREKDRILAEAREVGSGCSNYAKRVSLSKEAMKKAEDMKELIQKCKFESVTRPPHIAATSRVSFGKVTYKFDSRKRFEEGIMKTLRDRNVDKVGICGTGGVGKTIMAQEILNRALKDGLFDEIVMVIVGQKVEELAIQKNIAEPLGLTLVEETLKTRADKLRTRLRQEERTLLLLDDVWEDLNLEELGIPCDRERCTVILTSRDKDVLKGTKVEIENVHELGVLDEDESWDFFKKMTGTCVDDAILKPTAYDVMKECKGLLLALESVGKAHEDEKHLDVWRDSLEQLRKHNPVDIPNVIKEVYRPLKLSYKRLESKNAKSTFLLCCLFAEDAHISLEHLTYFAMGLRLFHDTWELEGVRGRIRRSINTLRNRCLLLDGFNEDYVRMHDVMRDVSIFIAEEKGRVKCSDCTWISSHVDGGARLVPLEESCFPKLKLLWMNMMNNMNVEEEMEINGNNLIGGSAELKVLVIEFSSMKSLPVKTTQAIKISLTTLLLHNCYSLESIAVVGQLESLEIFICRTCPSIKELLLEHVRGLKRLKLLEISYCRKFERVAAGVISSMVGLEELKMVYSFKNWKGGEIHKEGNEEASLREIESLKKLRRLEIDVSDIALAAQSLRLSPELLVQFTVRFGEKLVDFKHLPKGRYQRRTALNYGVGNDTNVGDLSNNTLLTRTECIYAKGRRQDFKLDLAIAQRIRWLSLKKFTNKKNITSTAAAFPLLEYLSLKGLPKLEEIWDDAPIPSNSFSNLKHLQINYMSSLKRMGKSLLSTVNDLFLQLETIDIRQCDEMEHLILVPNEEEDHKEKNCTKTVLTLPKLKKLHLDDLTKLRSMICSSNGGIESIQFPLLAQMEISGCESLKCLVSRDDGEEEEDHHYKDDDSLHLFCYPQVSFGDLKMLSLESHYRNRNNVWCDKVPIAFFNGLVEIYIDSFNKIRNLFSSSIARSLINLQKLHIRACRKMVKVIEDADEEVSSSSPCDHPTNPTTTPLFRSLQKLVIGGCWEMAKVIEDDEEVSSSCDHPTNPTTPLFPSLTDLTLESIDKLESFCEWRCTLELPSLKKLEIIYCEEMKSFNAVAGSLILTPALQTVTRNGRALESVDDLNAALHRHFEKEKRDQEEKDQS